MSVSRDRPVIPPGPRTHSLTAHVPEALHAAAHQTAELDGYASTSEWLAVLVVERVRDAGWRRRLAAEQGVTEDPTQDPDARSASDDPTEIDTGPPEQPLRERAPTTLPPVDELADEVNPDQPLEEGR